AFFENGNAKIFYEREGKGPPIFLLAPGGMRSANDLWLNMPWNPRESLVENFELIGMDQRNAGKSTAPITPNDDWDNYTADQLALLDHLGIEKCHVLGMCIGGPFIAGLLKAAPERFLSAVMLQPVGMDENQQAFYDMFNNWSADMTKNGATIEPKIITQFRGNMWDGDFLLTVTEEDVKQFETPILLFMGNDLYHPESISRKIASLAPNLTFVEQWKNPEDLERTDKAIRFFLTQHS
ncbi:MAG: alpha/beta hydrolase, partial [Acidimicrobiales bacterium]|nr:alpha/beta hydrolase [Acidimicrobiales bacterium]